MTLPWLLVDLENTQSSRSRLLHAAKLLFARNGFEQTSTAAIAREAGTSESQLVRYFRGKAGLLEAIFDDGWAPLNGHIQQAVGAAPSAREALLGVLAIVSEAFASDHAMAFLFLFEGRRTRGDSHEVLLSKGFQNFSTLLQTLVRRGTLDGTFPSKLHPASAAAALIGAVEGMIREMVIAERSSKEKPFLDDQVRTIFTAIVDGLAQIPRTEPVNRRAGEGA
ncbi:MAG TPA: TetR/AcrR family transcriptional regulator [Thermoanaerobaculia bacterium]|nr:TetR/AcrR family transcriptional regulator [Thermoanaerobaculia bacterium]